MDNLESIKYSDDLAKEIKTEPDMEKTEEFLMNAKSPDGAESQIGKNFNVREKRPKFGIFVGGDLNQDGEYTEPSVVQKEKFNKRNERMSEIFENADFEWYLDGAVNISLYGDKQIRDHKDLDMSIYKEDLEKFEEFLSKKGFAIFLNYKENGEDLMRKVTVKELSNFNKPDLSVCKIKTDGEIDKNSGEQFNYVDLHVHSKDTEGNTVINYTGTTIPKEYFIPIKKLLSNDKEINLSHPLVVAYHKLHSNREYDLIDLQKLKQNLKEKDLMVLNEIIKKEINESEKRIEEKLKDLWNILSPVLGLSNDEKVIYEKIQEDSDIKKRISDPKILKYISDISRYISERPKVSSDEFRKQSLFLLGFRKQMEQKLKAIN